MTDTSDDTRHFFVSFNQADRDWATWIVWVLEEKGYSVFFQDWDFRGSFIEQMHQASRRTGHMLVVLSDHYLRSEYTRSEVWAALARDPVGRKDAVVTVKVGSTTKDLGLFSHFDCLDLTTSVEADAERLILERARKAVEPDYRAKSSTRPSFPGGAKRTVPEKPSFPGVNPVLIAQIRDLRESDQTVFDSAELHHRLSKNNTRFTVYFPVEIKPNLWFTLIVYVHTLEMQTEVEKDAKQRLAPHSRRSTKATRTIVKGAEIVIVPKLPGCRFNPPSARILWLEDWHRIEFRLQAQPDIAGFELEKAVYGRVAFYIESVLVGEVSFWTCISDEAGTTAANGAVSAEAYEAIFVSYAHEDGAVVDRLGRAYKALGMKFLRDVEALRSGEEWNPALLAMIERANIFQLYWSRAAKRSRYVKKEWRHALKQEKSHFIRPLYWQVPMPQPPCELAQLHFSYFELDA